MNKLIVVLLGFSIFTTACQREVIHTKPTEPPAPTTDSTLYFVPYGEDLIQRMDVYLPAYRTKKTKTIIFLHGGAWYQGDKDQGTSAAAYFQKKGYAFITMNYRLTDVPTNTNPAQMQDIEHALDIISSKETEWNISGSRICLFGGSAGAHLALLYAYEHKEDTRVKAVISASGPTDLTDTTILKGILQPYIQAFIGFPYSENPNAYKDASPSNYLAKNCVPTLFFHGTADETVPCPQVVSAYNTLKTDGVNVTIRLFAKLGHDLGSVNDEILLEMEDFLKTAY